METNSASQTAVATAFLRAAHQVIDGQPRILEDPVAVPFLGPTVEPYILQKKTRFLEDGSKRLRSHLVLRSRYTEDRLSDAVKRGVSRYILMGAGLDTFAYRQPDWAKHLEIVEVDIAGTQAMKRDYLEKAGIGIPANTRLVSADFERESVGDVLSRQGITPKEPVFFSWLGVTMYLNEPAIRSALTAMAAFPEGSEVTLTYLHPADRHLLAESVERLGEPYVSCFDEPAMESLLRDAGFRNVAFLSAPDAHDRYYGRGDMALTVPGRTGLVSAVR